MNYLYRKGSRVLLKDTIIIVVVYVGTLMPQGHAEVGEQPSGVSSLSLSLSWVLTQVSRQACLASAFTI